MAHTKTVTNRKYKGFLVLDTHKKINSIAGCPDQIESFFEQNGYKITSVMARNQEEGKFNFIFEAPSKMIKSLKNKLNHLPCVVSYTIIKVKE